MYKLLFAGYSAENRTKASGYEHIVDFKDKEFDTYYLDAKNLPFGFISAGSRGKRINCYFLEFCMHSVSCKYDIIHNFYSDNQLLIPYPNHKHYKTIATTHLNYHDFSKWQLHVLRSYDAVIVLNSKEETVLKSLGINAIYIPHGFNAPVFNKNKNILDDYKQKINVCFSGVCYRDYEALEYFINVIQKRNDICLHILGQRKNTREYLRNKSYKNIVIYDFLSDDDYYSVFSSCDYSFLPLTFATANNTLMEAQSLGIPSILRDMEGIEDYACKEERTNIIYSKNENLLKIIDSLTKQDISPELVRYSQNFSWKEIFKTTKQLYKNVIEGKGATL